MENQENLIKNKMISFSIISIIISIFWSTLGIILSLALYFTPENNVSIFIKFLSNLLVLSVPAIVSILLGIFKFKKQYKLKYILMCLAVPSVIAICEHIVFMKIY